MVLIRAPRPQPIAPSASIKAIGALLALFNLLAVGFAAWVLVLSRQQHVARAAAATQNLAHVLEENVDDTIQRIDLAILSLQDEAHHDPLGKRLDVLVQAQFRRAGVLGSLQIVGPEGQVRHAVPAAARLDGTGHPFFQRLRAARPEDLCVSPPIQGSDGTWHLVLARRLERPGGGFAGAVLAILPTEQLARAMSRLDVGRRGSVSLRGADLGLLARYPDFAGSAKMIGDRRIQGGYLQAIAADEPSAQFTEKSVLDGFQRTYTLRRTEHPRFYILVGLARQDYLRAWRYQAAFTIAAVLGLALLTLTLGWQARSSWIRQQADRECLAAQEAKYRLLAENASDVIWSMDPDGRLTYVSPSILHQRGWTPEEFMALGPEERALSMKTSAGFRKRMARAHQLPPGSQPFENDLMQATVKRKDGREIQVEVQWRIVWGEEGRMLGFRGVSRDVTAQKRMEAERERLIQGLTQALADVKQLSGMLPICGSCKKIRDDHGYWSQIETYLSEHTEATFTHGVCPDCAQKFREEIQARRAQREGGETA